MLTLKWAWRVSSVLLVMEVLLAGCTLNLPADNAGNDGSSGPGNGSDGDPVETIQPSADALPDFSLPDVNAASARLGETVSPREYLGQVSAWYFGHAT